LSSIFYNYYTIEREHLQTELFLKMKNYSFVLEGEEFGVDIVDKKEQQLYELLMDKDFVYILTPLLEDTQTLMKITYPKSEYERKLEAIIQRLGFKFALLTLIIIIIALLFSLYALAPLKRSFDLMQEFMKDMIHDLNTPISSMVLNLKMLPNRSEELESLEQSIKVLASLHKNLDNYINTHTLIKTSFSLKETLTEQKRFFESIYDYIEWYEELEAVRIYSSKDSMERILYNLLSNACKYNTTKGSIAITLTSKALIIANDSYGIANPSKVFERFYKESDRGLGIGLHIVAKLSNELGVETTLSTQGKRVVVSIDLSSIIA